MTVDTVGINSKGGVSLSGTLFPYNVGGTRSSMAHGLDAKPLVINTVLLVGRADVILCGNPGI
jgi:hypothetical protein